METGTNIRQWYYRGSLRTCNYTCSYCPFSKHPKLGQNELEKDKQALVRFVNYMETHIKQRCAVQIVPYGEALIYTYYWKELAVLSSNSQIEAVGAQTNLSFPVDKMLAVYKDAGGKLEKLRLWGTFHPQQTSMENFLSQCQAVQRQHVLYCVGAVGVPEQIPVLKELRALLPKATYMWINKMDGLKRSYTEAEVQAFSEIDRYFIQELKVHKANPQKCVDSCFVEADGTMYPCNICRQSMGNLYQPDDNQTMAGACQRKRCSCYLAYCNQNEPELQSFAPYPAFRIPALVCL